MHHLGNLMMLPPGVNSSLKDRDPSGKAETYKTCGLLSSIEVAKLIARDRWDKAAVDARSADLLSWAKTQTRPPRLRENAMCLMLRKIKALHALTGRILKGING